MVQRQSVPTRDRRIMRMGTYDERENKAETLGNEEMIDLLVESGKNKGIFISPEFARARQKRRPGV